VTVGRKKDNEWFSTRVQTGWQGCIDYSKMKALTKKDHFPPPFFDQFMKWLAGYPYFCVLGSYSSYDHYPFDPGKLEHTILIVAFNVFTYCHRSSGSCNTPAVDSLAEDCKLSACRRQHIVSFSFVVI
jgi:hypothetical protein